MPGDIIHKALSNFIPCRVKKSKSRVHNFVKKDPKSRENSILTFIYSKSVSTLYFCLNANEKKAENLVAVMIIYT